MVDLFASIGFSFSLWWAFVRMPFINVVHASLLPSLYGTTLAQTIFYVRSFSSDNKATKWLVSDTFDPMSKHVWPKGSRQVCFLRFVCSPPRAGDCLIGFIYQYRRYLPRLPARPDGLECVCVRAVRWSHRANDPMVGLHVLLSSTTLTAKLGPGKYR
jgi:hypothetical protein